MSSQAAPNSISSRSLALSLSHTLTHSLTHSLFHSLSLSPPTDGMRAPWPAAAAGLQQAGQPGRAVSARCVERGERGRAESRKRGHWAAGSDAFVCPFIRNHCPYRALITQGSVLIQSVLEDGVEYRFFSRYSNVGYQEGA